MASDQPWGRLDSAAETRGWTVGAAHWQLGHFPKLMGIVNATPDSFSDGGQFLDPSAAVAHALRLVEDGADLLDIGGESTRPRSLPVTVDEELRRVIPLIEQLARQTTVPLSVDTTKARVAREALAAGAVIVNDISGLQFDPEMPAVCAETKAAVVCMHIQGTPLTMQDHPHYTDVVGEIAAYFAQRLESLAAAGIAPERVVLDPGIGFGKTAEHNLQLLSHIAQFRALGRPVLVGHSRKGFLKKLLGRPVDERSAGTVGVAVALAMQSTDLLRVHDIRLIRDALLAWHAIAERLTNSCLE